jgi:hypothetical protein
MDGWFAAGYEQADQMGDSKLAEMLLSFDRQRIGQCT